MMRILAPSGGKENLMINRGVLAELNKVFVNFWDGVSLRGWV